MAKNKHAALVVSGTACFAVWMTLQTFIQRSGRATDLTDFALGVLFGIGVGLMGLAAWRIGRDRRSAV
jgi:hypothetical protein